MLHKPDLPPILTEFYTESAEEFWNTLKPYANNCYWFEQPLMDTWNWIETLGFSDPTDYHSLIIQNAFAGRRILYVDPDSAERWQQKLLFVLAKMSQTLPLTNPLSVSISNGVANLHPGRARMLLRHSYTQPVKTFVYSEEPQDLPRLKQEHILSIYEQQGVRHGLEIREADVSIMSDDRGWSYVSLREFFAGDVFAVMNDTVTVNDEPFLVKDDGLWRVLDCTK
jgi:hypothetical protein